MVRHSFPTRRSSDLKEIYKLLGKNKVLLEMERWFGYAVLNVICRMVVVKRFGGAITKDENEGNDQC